MAEVQILHDCMDAGGRATPGAVAEEKKSAMHKCPYNCSLTQHDIRGCDPFD